MHLHAQMLCWARGGIRGARKQSSGGGSTQGPSTSSSTQGPRTGLLAAKGMCAWCIHHFLDVPVHGAAYCLDPEFWGDRGLALGNDADSCVRHLRTTISRLVPAADAQKARLSYAAFRAREGIFADADALADADTMPAHQWWDMYGGAHPELQRVAIRLLSQVSSACSCERAWSAYEYIHNKRRNRLTAARARDLVYVFTNGRLANKLTSSEEKFIEWDDEEQMLDPEAE